MTRNPSLDLLIEWLKRRWGIQVQETQCTPLSAFLDQRLEGLTWGEYRFRVETENAERAALLDAATIGETYFFRDEAQFRLLRDRMFPFFRDHKKSMPRLWSAACSTGEEAISLLVLLADAWGASLETCRGRVWASDLNPKALEQFSSGVFRLGSLRQDGESFHQLLDPYMERGGKSLHIPKDIIDLIQIREINLITETLDLVPGNVDILLLRNMMMYVPFEERSPIYRKVSEKLSSDGVLVLGKAELPFFQEPSMVVAELDGTFVLIKETSRFLVSEKQRNAW
jgi:chemotaxis protein methyltransferase CheR